MKLNQLTMTTHSNFHSFYPYHFSKRHCQADQSQSLKTSKKLIFLTHCGKGDGVKPMCKSLCSQFLALQWALYATYSAPGKIRQTHFLRFSLSPCQSQRANHCNTINATKANSGQLMRCTLLTQQKNIQQWNNQHSWNPRKCDRDALSKAKRSLRSALISPQDTIFLHI